MMMTNKDIYKKTITFSLHRLLYDLLAFLLLGVMGAAGFLLMERFSNRGLIGLGIGLLIGLFAVIFILRYVSYTYKAGQIAMMTKGVTEGKLPDNVLQEGKAVVKRRFTTVAVFFAVTNVIRGIFNQLSRGMNSVGRAVGGKNGEQIASIISAAIQTVVAYLCDCCLGWVFYREEQNAAKATCEGAVLFFKHGKTLMKNLGHVFGIGLLSLLVIGGAFCGVFFALFSRFPALFEEITADIGEVVIELEKTVPEILSNPQNVMLVCAIVAAVILWSILHSVFVHPFVLVGVLRNYLESGMNDIPAESSFAILDSKSERFKKLHAEGI